MDLTIQVNETSKINIRSTGIIIHNNKILLHHNINRPYYALIGGRVKLFENSEEAAKREFEEETGEKVYVEKHLTTIENFYEYKGFKVYEIEFVYKLEFEDNNLKNMTDIIYNKEGKDYLQYEWIDLNNIDTVEIRPFSFKDYFKNNTAHLINDELNVK